MQSFSYGRFMRVLVVGAVMAGFAGVAAAGDAGAAADGFVPRMYGERVFFEKADAASGAMMVYVRDNAEADVRVLLDPRKVGDVGEWFPSPDGKLLAYTVGGGAKMVLRFRDVGSASDTAFAMPFDPIGAFAWNPDQRGFTYVRYSQSMASYCEVLEHKLGTGIDKDRVIWKGKPEVLRVSLRLSADGKMQILSARGGRDVYARKQGESEFAAMVADAPVEVAVEPLGDRVYIVLGPNGETPNRVVTALKGDTSPAAWKDFVVETKGVIRQVLPSSGKVLLRVDEGGASRLVRYSREGENPQEIKLPAAGRISAVNGRSDQVTIFFDVVTGEGRRAYQYNLGSEEMKVVE